MRRILYIAFFLTPLVSFSQTLTNRQVYDFNIGDVFYYNKPSYKIRWGEKDSVIYKFISSTNDSISYKLATFIRTETIPDRRDTTILDTLLLCVTKLDSAVFDTSKYQKNPQTPPNAGDSTFNYLDTGLCNIMVQGFKCFDGSVNHDESFSAGLGKIIDLFVVYTGSYDVYKDKQMIGYKKGLLNCNYVGISSEDLRLNNNVNFKRTDNKISINIPNNVKHANLSVFNLQGQLVLQSSLTNQEYTIDNSILKDPIYIVKIQTESETLTFKIAH